MRFLCYWALRKDDARLCATPTLCPQAPDNETRCPDCPLEKLEREIEETVPGRLLQRALELRAALNLGVTITLDGIPADEFSALLQIENEQDRFDRENAEQRPKGP